jgi:hypothetical protein
MKTFLFAVVTFISSIAVSSPADSIRCPLQNPFVLKIRVSGLFSESNHTYSSYFDEIDSIDYRDSTRFTFSMMHDTLRYQEVVSHGPDPWTVVIIFDTVHHTIPYLSCSKYVLSVGSYDESHSRRAVVLRDLLFDSSSIYSDDLILNNHLVSAAYQDGESHWGPGNHSSYTKDLQTTTAFDLYGGTRSSHFSPEATVAFSSRHSFEIHPYSQSLRFDFSDSNCEIIELYSILGNMVVRSAIQPGQTSLSIDYLPTGLYLVRLKNEVQKVYVVD